MLTGIVCGHPSHETILQSWPRQSRGDIVEALQCLKCMYHNDLIFRKVDTSAEEEKILDDEGFREEAEKSAPETDESETFTWDQIIVDDIADSDGDVDS
ncbi:hypothetical protein BDZ94DRAFT_1205870, partial [Collybia nuda]